MLLVGCATPIKPAAMTPAAFEVPNKHNATVQLNIQGGVATDAMGTSQISGPDFQLALAGAIRSSGVFSQLKESAADYNLSVGIISVNQPSFGVKMVVSMATEWKLTRIATSEVVFKELIVKSSEAGMKKGFLGSTRCRVATQGAAQENIKAGILLLSELKL